MVPSQSPKKRSRPKSRRVTSGGGRRPSFPESIDIDNMVLQLCHMQHYLYWLKSLGSRDDILSSGNIDMYHLQDNVGYVIMVLEQILPTYDLANLKGGKRPKAGSPLTWMEFLPPDMEEFFTVLEEEELTEEQKTQVKCYQVQKAVGKALAKIKRRADYIVNKCVKDGEIPGSENWSDEKIPNDRIIKILNGFIEWAEDHPNPTVSLVGKTEDGKKRLITFKSSAKRIEGAKVSKTKTTRTSSTTRYEKE